MAFTAWTGTSRPKSGWNGLTDHETLQRIYDPNGLLRPSTSRPARRTLKSAMWNEPVDTMSRMQSAPPQQRCLEERRQSLSEESTSDTTAYTEETSFATEDDASIDEEHNDAQSCTRRDFTGTELTKGTTDDCGDAQSHISDVTAKPWPSNKVHPFPDGISFYSKVSYLFNSLRHQSQQTAPLRGFYLNTWHRLPLRIRSR